MAQTAPGANGPSIELMFKQIMETVHKSVSVSHIAAAVVVLNVAGSNLRLQNCGQRPTNCARRMPASNVRSKKAW